MPIWLGFLVVFLGSGVGGMLRHGVGIVALRLMGPTFPWGTLAINVVGSALMGMMIGLFAAKSIENAELRLFVTTGLIGGFTTWSTFSLDAVTLWERGETGAGGEIQLTDAMKHLAKEQKFYGMHYEGRTYDTGSKLGFLTANLAYALEREDLAGPLKQEIRRLLGER